MVTGYVGRVFLEWAIRLIQNENVGEQPEKLGTLYQKGFALVNIPKT